MKNLLILLLLILSFNANSKDLEMADFRGEIVKLRSMSDVAKDSDLKKFLPLFITDCKALRGEVEQCEATGTEPVVGTIHLTWLMEGPTLLPKDFEVKVGDFVVSETIDGKAPKIIELLDKKVCKWGFRLLNAGAQQLECEDDETKGWEQGTAIMFKNPLKTVQK